MRAGTLGVLLPIPSQPVRTPATRRVRSLAPAVLGLAALLAGAAAASAQTPPAIAYPGDTAIAASAANQTVPALARGGDQILAVWQDNRTSPIFSGEQADQDIWATRLDANGVPIDAVPFPVNMDGGDQKTPAVAWNGEQWLVAWVGQVSTAFYYTDALLAARVAADGTVLDPIPIVIQPDLGSGTMGDVASNGRDWAVFFTGWSGAVSQVLGVRVAPDGAVIDTPPAVVNTPGASPSTPYGVSADWAGTNYLVAWSQWSAGLDDVRAQRASASLAPVGGTLTLASSADYEVHPDVASDGSSFFVVWDRYNNCCVGGASKVYGTRVTAGGAVLDGPIGLAIYDTSGYGFQGSDPAVSWDGMQWIASWTESASGGMRVNAGRISAAGVVLDFNGFEVDPVPPRQEASAVVGRPGGGSLVVWQDGRAVVGQAYDVYGAWLDFGGNSVPVGALALAAPSQVHADAAALSGGGALLAWTSMESGSTRVLVQRTSASGTAIGDPVQVAAGAQFADAHVAWNGTVGMVTWQTGTSGIQAVRIDADGRPIDAAAFAVMPGWSPDVAAQGDTFLVTSLIPEPNPELVNVRSRRVSAATGAVIDAAPVLVGQTYATSQAVIAYEGGYLLAWQRHSTHDQPYSSILLRLVSADNVPGAQAGFTSISSYNQRPVLAQGSGGALLVWQIGSFYSLEQDVMARVVGPGLTLPGGIFAVSAAALSQQAPSVAWDGAEYVVTWQDRRANGPTYLFDDRTDVYAARVTAGGAVLDAAGIALATDAAPEGWPTAVALGGGAALVAWSDFLPQEPHASYRMRSTALGTPSPWTDLGHALAGTFGTPALSGLGSLVPATALSLQLASAPPSAPAAWVFGAQAVDLPFAGGVLVPSLDLIQPFSTSALGSASIGGTWPAGATSGWQLYFQTWVLDLGLPGVLSASNAIVGTTP